MTGLKFCGDCRHFDDRRLKCRAGVRGITWYVSNHCVRFDGVQYERGDKAARQKTGAGLAREADCDGRQVCADCAR